MSELPIVQQAWTVFLAETEPAWLECWAVLSGGSPEIARSGAHVKAARAMPYGPGEFHHAHS